MRKNRVRKMLVLGCAVGFILSGCGNQNANTQQTGSTPEVHTNGVESSSSSQEVTSEEVGSLEETTPSEANTDAIDASTTEAMPSQASESDPALDFDEGEIEF